MDHILADVAQFRLKWPTQELRVPAILMAILISFKDWWFRQFGFMQYTNVVKVAVQDEPLTMPTP